jgi:hypothetical protein
VKRESLADKGLRYIRKNYKNGKIYFINNPGDTAVEDWIPITAKATSVALFNPLNEIKGKAALRQLKNSANEVYLQLQPGESCILQTFNTLVEAPGYPYIKTCGEAFEFAGTWSIEFIEGGPVLPATIETQTLDSWTNLGDSHTKAFSGTAVYTIEFKFSNKSTSDYLLDLGEIFKSGVVILNDTVVDTLITSPYQCIIPIKMFKGKNQLKIKISNLMANRIADLDRQNVKWKKFYNINFPAKLRENLGEDRLFTTVNWKPMKSGLIGPVTLTPIEYMEFK